MRVRLLAVALALAGAAAAVRAQPAPSQPVIVVVDMTQIMREAKAAKDVRDDLERQRNALAPEVFSQRSQEYQQRYVALDRDVQAKRQGLQQSYSDAMTRVENVAMQIISDVAKERKATMVVAKAALLYMNDGMDVTQDVTKRLDEKLPTMAVGPPKEGGEAPAKAMPGALPKK